MYPKCNQWDEILAAISEQFKALKLPGEEFTLVPNKKTLVIMAQRVTKEPPAGPTIPDRDRD